MNTDRTYYYEINEEKSVPDHESMAAFLLDEDIFYISPNKDTVRLCVNINDYFVPGSDAEFISYDEIPVLFALYTKKSYDGVCEFIANKRGIKNKRWRENI